MKFGVYEVNLPGVLAIPRMVFSAARVNLFGVPEINGNLEQIVTKTIKENSKDNRVLAGKSHFVYMWTVDFAKAYAGISKVMPEEYLKKITQRIIDVSFRMKYVPTCFGKFNAFDMPYKRHDNLPWLIYAIDKHKEVFGEDLFSKNKKKIEFLCEKYLEEYFDKKTFLIKNTSKFDWMDSVLRPSSTYSNICLLKMFQLCKQNQIKTENYEKETEKAIIEQRFNGNYFIDYANNGNYLVADANVVALYFELFSKEIRENIFKSIENSKLIDKIPIKIREGDYDKKLMPILTKFSPRYHSVTWTHFGLMYLNGLKKNNHPYKKHLEKIEKVFLKYKNIIETVDGEKAFTSPFFSTEYNFTMSAAQYLELIKN